MFDIQGVNRIFSTNMQPRLYIFLDLENIIGVRLVNCEYIQSYNSHSKKTYFLLWQYSL